MFLNGHEMLVSGLILAVSYIIIAFEIVPKMTAALFGAALTLVLGLISQDKVFGYIDFKVIFLLISMMVIVNIANRSGVFNWLAMELLKRIDGRPFMALFILATFTAVSSAFLDNMTAVILVMPITFIVAREFMIDPIPFFITEIIASNIGGTATLIGDPPNIIIGSRAGLSFMDFVRELTPIVIVIYLVSIAILLFMFRKKLDVSSKLVDHIKDLDNSNAITDKNLMIRSIVVLLLVIAGFVFHGALHTEAYVVALTGASFLLLFESSKQALHDVEWVTISFFVGLFIIIGGFEASGGIHLLAQKLVDITHGSTISASMVILWISGEFSAKIEKKPYIKNLNSKYT